MRKKNRQPNAQAMEKRLHTQAKDHKTQRSEECKRFGFHVLSLALSITLAQIWVGYLLTKSNDAVKLFGMSSPTEDIRSLVLFSVTIVGLFFAFEELKIVDVPAGFGVVKYV